MSSRQRYVFDTNATVSALLFLELAVSGQASHIVTGDEDLLVLHPFRGISIVTPRRFLELLDQAPNLGMA